MGDSSVKLLLVKITDDEVAMSERQSLVNEDFLDLFLACLDSDTIRLGKYASVC
jgi:hypothetical protein